MRNCITLLLLAVLTFSRLSSSAGCIANHTVVNGTEYILYNVSIRGGETGTGYSMSSTWSGDINPGASVTWGGNYEPPYLSSGGSGVAVASLWSVTENRYVGTMRSSVVQFNDSCGLDGKTFYFGDPPTNNCTTRLNWCFVNDTAVPQAFQLYYKGAAVAGGGGFAFANPGQRVCLLGPVNCDTNGANYSVKVLEGTVQLQNGGTNGQYLVSVDGRENLVGGFPSASDFVTGNTTSGNTTAYAGSGGSLDVSAIPTNAPSLTFPTNADTTTSIQGGLSGLYNAIQNAASAAHGDATDIKNSVQNGNAGISNLLSFSANTDIGISNQLAGFRRENSNNLSGILQQLRQNTNSGTALPTNFYGQWETNMAKYSIPGWTTNESELRAFIEQQASMGEAMGSIDDLAAVFEPPGGGGPSLGDSPEFNIPLGRFTMSVQPVGGRWDGMWSFITRLFKWILVAAYVMRVMKDIFEIVPVIASSKATDVPTLNLSALGFGGNVGAALHPIIVMLTLIIWAGVVTVIMLLVAGDMVTIGWFFADPGSYLSGDGGASGVGYGISMFLKVIPMDFIQSLVLSYCVFRITMFKAGFTASAMMRALMG